MEGAFLAAALTGDLAELKELLRNGCPANAKNERGLNALHKAAAGGHVDTIKYLAPRMESMLHSSDDYGYNMVTWAAQEGHADVVKLVVEQYNLDPAARDKDGRTPVLLAAFSGHTSIIELLVDQYHCSLTDVNNLGRNALHLAAEGGHVNTIEYLAPKMDSLLQKTDDSGCTMVHHAARKGHADVVRLVIDNLQLDPTARDKDGMTPVLLAALKGHTSIIELLVDQYHCSLTDVNNVGENALHKAAEGGCIDTIRYLTRKMDSLIHRFDYYGETMLHCAAHKGHADVVRFLIDELKLNPTARNKAGETPVVLASLNGHSDLVDVLVGQYGCSMSDEEGLQYAFLSAAGKGDLEEVKNLIGQGCPVNTTDQRGWNALHHAAYGGQVDVIRYLAPKMESLLHETAKSGNNMLHFAAGGGHADVVRVAVENYKVDLAARDVFGLTPVLRAAYEGWPNIIDLLVNQYNVSLNDVDNDGRNALHLAAQRGHIKTIHYLAPKMASLLHSTDHQGFTMLHFAAEKGHAEVVQILIKEYKLDPTARDKRSVTPGVPTSESGETPLHKAVKLNHHRVAQLLIQNGALAAIEDPGPLEEAITHGDLSTAKKLLQTAKSETESNTASESKNKSEPEIPPTWRSDYEEAVKKQGSVKVAINCCIFAGPPGKGKSCLKHLLVHDKPKEVKTSTGVMEKPDVVTISTEKYAVEGTSVWLPLTDGKMASSIKSSCQKRQYHVPEDGPEDQRGKLAQPVTEINPPTAASKATSHSPRADPSDNESESPHLQPSANTSDVSAFHQAHSRLMCDPSLGEGMLLNGAQFVHLLDTGGQPSFQAVLPLLLDVPCTYVLVFNAAEGLNAPVPITYRPDDTTVVKSGSRPETAWAMMLRSLSSVYTLVHKVSGDVRALLVDNRLPPLRTVLVGTFADQLEQMGNIATATEEIGMQIKQLENKPYYSSLIPNSDGQLFHLVNNLPHQEASERTPREQASINNLREVLSHPAGALNAKIPIGWYQFEMVSRMVDQKFFKFSELLDHARELKCITSADPSREFRSLLQLFHSLGVFTFIDREDVSHMVCTDSSVFLQVVSKLLAVGFKIPKCIAVRTFKETGILSLDTSLFNELGISKEVDPVWLLHCLCYLGVAACLSLPSADTLEYFIPAALPSEDKENVSEHSSVAPLMVAFQFQANAFLSTEDLPHGIFARLAVELANKGWKVSRKKNTRLVIRFRWEELAISIVESAGCIHIVPIVSVLRKCTVAKLHERCTAVRFTVEAAIQTSARAVFGSKFTEKAKPIFAFFCPCEASPTHLAVPSGNTLVCNLSSDDQECSTSQKVWFCPIEGGQLQPHPSNPTILQLVDPTSGGGRGGGDSLQSSDVTRMVTLQTGRRQKRVHAQLNPASCSKKRAMSPRDADSLQSSNVTNLGTLQTGNQQKRGHVEQNPASCSKKRAMSPQKADSTDSPQCDDAILSEKVSDHPRHLMLFRRHISRRAAGKGRAVLEGVGLDAPTIAACFTAHPLNEEGAVQEGLTKWCGGEGFQPPTWRVLVEAIEYAHIAQQDIEALKRALS